MMRHLAVALVMGGSAAGIEVEVAVVQCGGGGGGDTWVLQIKGREAHGEHLGIRDSSYKAASRASPPQVSRPRAGLWPDDGKALCLGRSQ